MNSTTQELHDKFYIITNFSHGHAMENSVFRITSLLYCMRVSQSNLWNKSDILVLNIRATVTILHVSMEILCPHRISYVSSLSKTEKSRWLPLAGVASPGISSMFFLFGWTTYIGRGHKFWIEHHQKTKNTTTGWRRCKCWNVLYALFGWITYVERGHKVWTPSKN